jgi:hypothetical protein
MGVLYLRNLDERESAKGSTLVIGLHFFLQTTPNDEGNLFALSIGRKMDGRYDEAN